MKCHNDAEFRDMHSVISNWESKISQETDPRATKVSREIKKKHGSSVLSENSDKMFSTISKRLCSLVNTNSKNEKAPTNTDPSSSFSIVLNNSSSAESKYQNECSDSTSKLKNYSTDQDHNKLRDFLKQISVEKNGLLVNHGDEVVDKTCFKKDNSKENTLKNSMTSKDKNGILKSDNEERMKLESGEEILYERMHKIGLKKVAHQHPLTLDKSISKDKIDLHQGDIQKKKSDNKLDIRSVESTNKTSFMLKKLKKKAHSTISIDRCSIQNTKNDNKLGIRGDELQARNSSTEHLEKNSLSKLNFMFAKFSRNKKDWKNYKNCPGQTNNDNTFRMTISDHLRNDAYKIHEQNLSKNEFHSRRRFMFGKSDGDTSQMAPNDIKPQMTFTKKLFRIFSQSGNQCETKKHKLLFDSTFVIIGITLDNIINLATILSVEFVKTREKVRTVASKLESKPNVTSTKIDKDINPYKIGVKGFESVKPLRQTEKDISTKKKVLSFDMNGRFVRDDVISSTRLGNSNHRSWSNLYSSRYQSSLRSINSSTLSISKPRTDNSKLLRIAFNSRDRGPLNIKPKSVSSTGLSPRVLTESPQMEKKGNEAFENTKIVKEKQELVETESGGYRITLPIYSDFNFMKLNDIFLLKDDLYNQYKSILLVKPNDITDCNKINNGRTNVVWFLYILGTTKEILNRSLQLTSSRFPEWNLRSYIDD